MFPTKETVSHSEISSAAWVCIYILLLFTFFCLFLVSEHWIQQGLALQSKNIALYLCSRKATKTKMPWQLYRAALRKQLDLHNS